MGLLERLLGMEDPPKKKGITEKDLYKEGISPRGKALYDSPLADSLYQIAGKPKKFGELIGGYNLRGLYDTKNDELRVAFDDEKDEKGTLKHEMGHKYVAENVRNIAPKMYQYPSKPRQGATPLEIAANDKLDEYGKRGGANEAFANAYRNAFEFLSETQRDPNDYRRKMGEMEAKTPGAGELVRKMLDTDLFKSHKLRSVLTGYEP